MIEFLYYLFGQSEDCSNRKDIATPYDSNKSVANTTDEDEVLKLAELHGPLAEGVTIELSLQQALSEFPRKRHRSDSFSGLIRKVKKDYGTNLIITGRKVKIAPKSVNS